MVLCLFEYHTTDDIQMNITISVQLLIVMVLEEYHEPTNKLIATIFPLIYGELKVIASYISK